MCPRPEVQESTAAALVSSQHPLSRHGLKVLIPLLLLLLHLYFISIIEELKK